MLFLDVRALKDEKSSTEAAADSDGPDACLGVACPDDGVLEELALRTPKLLEALLVNSGRVLAGAFALVKERGRRPPATLSEADLEAGSKRPFTSLGSTVTNSPEEIEEEEFLLCAIVSQVGISP